MNPNLFHLPLLFIFLARLLQSFVCHGSCSSAMAMRAISVGTSSTTTNDVGAEVDAVLDGVPADWLDR